MSFDRMLRRTEVQALTGLSQSTIYRLMREGKFPVGVKVGPKAVRWRESTINEFLNSCPPAEGDGIYRRAQASA